MLPGEGLHEQEEGFFEFVQSRSESAVEKWAQLLNYPILNMDETNPMEANVNFIIKQI